MAVLPIRVFGDPVLKERCLEVEEVGPDIEQLVRDLVDSLPQPGGAGLSANQIGVVKRVFVYEREGEIEACINPRIISASEEVEEEVEGCLSLPGAVVPVPRHLTLELEYLDLSGAKHLVQAEGWIARVFQHEIDHLDGKLILERTDRESRVEALQLLQEGNGSRPETRRGTTSI
ncbi:MAG: peptide deformylase [Actinomycetota bacterium]